MRKTIIPMLAGIMILSACGSKGGKTTSDVKLETDDQKLSYSIGYDIAKNLSGQGISLELEALYQGLADGLGGDSVQPKLTKEEMTAAFQNFQKQQMEKMQQQAQQQAGPNEAAGQQYMEQQMASNPNIKKTASGLLYEVIKEGKGKKPTLESVVKVNYTGTLIDGTIFDSTEGKEPAVFPLNGVIPGWQEGLQLMSVGAQYRLIIPSSLAYGNTPPPGTPIQPGSTLIFTVELVNIEK